MCMYVCQCSAQNVVNNETLTYGIMSDCIFVVLHKRNINKHRKYNI